MAISRRVISSIKIVIGLIVLPTALLLATLSKSMATGDEPVILTTHDLYPYGYRTEAEGFIGSAVDVVRCVFEKIERPYKIDIVPWKRAQIMVKDGHAAGFFAGSHNLERDKYAQMSTPIADQNWMWYALKNSSINPDSDKFKTQASVSSFLGANMHKWLTANGYNISNTPPHNTESLLEMLLAKRLDAILANDQVMAALLSKSGETNNVSAFLNKNKPLGVYFSKTFLNENPDFLNTFNKYVPECRKSAVRDIYLR